MITTKSNHYSYTNNPFNVRGSKDNWLGKKGINQNNFVVFDTIENGLRAGLKNLNTQFSKRGGNTINKLINIYAPPSENDTKTYIANVVKAVGKSEHTVLTKNDLPLIGVAILRQEFGYTPDPETYKKAVKAALGNIIEQALTLVFRYLLQRLGL